MLLIAFTLPIQVVSEANQFEHWTKAHKRHKDQKRAVKHLMSDLALYRDMPLLIKLIRISPRKLDNKDNLPMAFKYVADEIARIIYPEKEEVKAETIKRNLEHNANLKPGEKSIRIRFQNAGRADDSSLLKWEYDQEKGKVREKGIRVEIYERQN